MIHSVMKMDTLIPITASKSVNNHELDEEYKGTTRRCVKWKIP